MIEYKDTIENFDSEEWRVIDNTAGKYLVSNYGRVKSLKHRKPKLLSIHKNNKGYYRVALCIRGKSKHILVHRLVAKAFVYNDDPKVKDTIDHIDEDKTNNKASNL